MPRESDSRRDQMAGVTSEDGIELMTDSMNAEPEGSTVGNSQGSAEGIGYCIFKVPQSLYKINRMAYQPNTVPIGPYHHNDRRFQKIQKHKRRFSIDLLNRTNQSREKLKHLAEALKAKEEEIRKCYSEALAFNSDELAEMMVLDGCFIIELFCKYSRKSEGHTGPRHDPLLTEPWVLPFLLRDLAKLENQIPWFVLKDLFDQTLGSSNMSHLSLSDLALRAFNRMLQRDKNTMSKHSSKEGKHLLDLLRSTYIQDSPRTGQRSNEFLGLIQPVNKLREAGIKFKPIDCDSFMEIKFSNGVLEIPVLKFDDFLSSLLLNFIAFEQCHSDSSKYVTTYATFMACLLNTSADAEFLCNCKIIERYFGTDAKIAHYFSNIGKDVVFTIRQNYLRQVFEDVNRYCEEDWRVHLASFKNTYFKTRWSLVSAIAAVVLLALTTVQSFYAVYAYYRPPP